LQPLRRQFVVVDREVEREEMCVLAEGEEDLDMLDKKLVQPQLEGSIFVLDHDGALQKGCFSPSLPCALAFSSCHASVGILVIALIRASLPFTVYN
jgi:hypothetical protein